MTTSRSHSLICCKGNLDSVGVQVVPAASAAVIEQVLVLIQHQDDQGLPRCLDQHGLEDLHQVHLHGDGHGNDCLHGPVCQDGRPRQVPHDVSVQQEEEHITMELVINQDAANQNCCGVQKYVGSCLLYTSPSPRDRTRSRMPSSA